MCKTIFSYVCGICSVKWSFFIFRKIVFHCILKLLVKFLSSLFAEWFFGFQHIKCMHIGLVNIYFGFDAGCSKILDECAGFGEKRFTAAYEGIRRRKIGVVGLSCRCCIGGYVFLCIFSKVQFPGNVIFPGIPYFSVIIGRGFGVKIIKHRIQGHLIGNMDFAAISRHHTDCRT